MTDHSSTCPLCAARDGAADHSAACGTMHSASEPDTPPIDYDRFLQRCLGDLEFSQRVLTMFCERFADDIETLRVAFADGEMETLTGVAHRMKGSSGNVAADGLNVIVARIEELSEAGELDAMPDCLEQLQTEWTRFRQFAKELLTAEAAASG